jgi:hypothetical protein
MKVRGYAGVALIVLCAGCASDGPRGYSEGTRLDNGTVTREAYWQTESGQVIVGQVDDRQAGAADRWDDIPEATRPPPPASTSRLTPSSPPAKREAPPPVKEEASVAKPLAEAIRGWWSLDIEATLEANGPMTDAERARARQGMELSMLELTITDVDYISTSSEKIMRDRYTDVSADGDTIRLQFLDAFGDPTDRNAILVLRDGKQHIPTPANLTVVFKRCLSVRIAARSLGLSAWAARVGLCFNRTRA